MSTWRKAFFADSQQTNIWPSVTEVAIAGVLALIIVAIDTYFSTQIGLLTYPPYYDGIAYVLGAKRDYYLLAQWAAHPTHPLALIRALVGTIAPLWQALITFSFLILGEGEWQAYTVRFWPTFLLLLLMIWVIQRRSCKPLMWVTLAFTALLPTLSVGLRASVSDYFLATVTARANIGLQWYVADLRPDLLFAVLLLWSIVPLIEYARSLNRRLWLVSGTFASLATLVKASESPVLFIALIVTVTYVLAVNRHALAKTFMTGLWMLLPIGILVGPWATVVGARLVFGYIYSVGLGQNSVIWSIPNPTLLSLFSYYWQYFPFHMGTVEGWSLLAVGLAVFLYSLHKQGARKDSRAGAYLIVSIVLWVTLSIFSAKNYFLGLAFYVVIWLFAWIVIASFLGARVRRNRIVSLLLLLIICVYAGSFVVGGFYSLHNWPTEARELPEENREVMQQIAADLRSYLRDNDTFMWAPAYGSPNTLQYYMMDNQGKFPLNIRIDRNLSPAQFIEKDVSKCQAILAFDDDIDTVTQFFSVVPLDRPYMRAVAEWVKQPTSSFEAVRTYHLITENGRLTLHLYIKTTNQTAILSQRLKASYDIAYPSAVGHQGREYDRVVLRAPTQPAPIHPRPACHNRTCEGNEFLSTMSA